MKHYDHHKKIVWLILLISICFISQAQQTDSSKVLPGKVSIDSSGNRYATLYVYRPRTFDGSIVSYDLHAGDSVICKVKNGSQHIIQLFKQGKLEFWAQREGQEKISVKINVEAGKKYYLRTGFSPLGELLLYLVTPEQGQQEFPGANKKGAGDHAASNDSARPGWIYAEVPSKKSGCIRKKFSLYSHMPESIREYFFTIFI
jgi:hypothetical protein